jgi:hypothetical protein
VAARPGRLEEYLQQLAGAVTDVHTRVSDVEEHVSRGGAIVTCRIDQDYLLKGERRHVSAPTTMALRREGGESKPTLFHSISIREHE